MQYSIDCTENQLRNLAASCANNLEPGAVIYINGDLGAGKTTFCRAFIKALGFSGVVQSPTYTWLQAYDLPGHTVLHMDMYLAKQKHIAVPMLLADYMDSNATIIVEWPSLVADLPPADIDITLSGDGEVRVVVITANQKSAEEVVEKIRALHEV